MAKRVTSLSKSDGGKSRYAKATRESSQVSPKTPSAPNKSGEASSPSYQGSEEEDDDKYPDSDNLDEDEEFGGKAKSNGKRKRAAVSPRKKATPVKKQKPTKKAQEIDEDSDVELAEGEELVGRVVSAPKTGRVPPGQISQNTLNFLAELKKPECNDRVWFRLHEPVYRLAEAEWRAFIEEFTNLLVDVDPQIPPLPPKDVIHRIYRDVRFSNDKSPYKTGFSASFSRSGRKGIFAHYHIAVKPGSESLIAGGAWCPGKNELATIRSHILRSPARLRQVISAKEFVRLFGEPSPDPSGTRRSIFGFEDELKTAPKGIDKNHKDIDLLKCRSFAVVHRFTDAEVLKPDFNDELARVAKVLRPFVHLLNDMMTIPADDSDEGEGEEGEE